jgi:hypothetical protein
MRKYIAFLLIFGSLNSLAQNLKPEATSQIVILGKLSDAVIASVKTPLTLEVFTNYNYQYPAPLKTIPIIVKNGKFKVKFTPNTDVIYFDLTGVDLIKSNTEHFFLAGKGDSVFMDITSNAVSFSGKGAKKMNFQHWAGELMYSNLKFLKSSDTKDLIQFLSYKKRLAIWNMALTLDSLNKDSSISNPTIKNILRLSSASSINEQYLNGITFPKYFSDTVYLNTLKHEVNFLIVQQNGFVETNTYLIKNSFEYVEYLFELNKIIAEIRVKNRMVPVSIVYQNIKSEYTGILRDKLLPFCFLTMLKQDTGAIKYLPDALSIVSDSNSRQILLQARKAKSPGVQAFKFNFQRLNGKPIKLDDFKGKIVILETYFNGCVYCKLLAEHMEPITEYFKNRNDVIFISVDGEAKDYNTFKNGANSGSYGSKQSIYAWNGGLGQKDPFLIYYQYNSFPNILMIGKDGNIISANPAKPFDKTTQQNFIKLIEENI